LPVGKHPGDEVAKIYAAESDFLDHLRISSA
jgi:hypothetical protein